MKKKVFAVLLCLCMVVSALPMAAFAEGEADEPAVASELPEAVNDVIKMVEDVTLAKIFVVTEEVTLDLNGYTLTTVASPDQNGAAKAGYTICVMDDGDLTIIDTAGDGLITNGHSTASTICVSNNGKATIGTNSSKEFTIDNGEKTNTMNSCIKVDELGELTINCGTIEGPNNDKQRSMQSFGKTTINGGTFTKEVQTWSYTEGDTVYESTLTINGGTFEDKVLVCGNTSPEYAPKSTLEINDGTFMAYVGNDTTRDGVDYEDATVEINGGELAGDGFLKITVATDDDVVMADDEVRDDFWKGAGSYMPSDLMRNPAASTIGVDTYIGGTAKYVEGWTKFSSIDGEEDGNYVILKIAKPEGTDDSIAINSTVSETSKRPIPLTDFTDGTDGDQYLLYPFRLTDNSYDLVFEYDGIEYTVHFNNLKLESTATPTSPTAPVGGSGKPATQPEQSEQPTQPEQPTVTPGTPVGQIFADVNGTEWYAEALQYAVDNGITSGTTSATGALIADAGKNTTRIQFMIMLARMKGAEVTGTWAEQQAQGLAWATQNGVTTGGADNGSNISKEQLAVMLYRLAGSPEVTGELTAPDAAKVSSWATDAMIWAGQNGILNGNEKGELDPQGDATRAMVFKMLMVYNQMTATPAE